METSEELIFSGKKFSFRSKTYKFHGYIRKPAIIMKSEDGDLYLFGDGSPIQEEFKLIEDS
jgi:hypothetical protein